MTHDITNYTKKRDQGEKKFPINACSKVKGLLCLLNVLKYGGFISISHDPRGKLQPETNLPPLVNI